MGNPRLLAGPFEECHVLLADFSENTRTSSPVCLVIQKSVPSIVSIIGGGKEDCLELDQGHRIMWEPLALVSFIVEGL